MAISTPANEPSNADLAKQIATIRAQLATLTGLPGHDDAAPSGADAWIAYAARQAETAAAERRAAGLEPPIYRRPQAQGNTGQMALAEGNTPGADPMQPPRSARPQGNRPQGNRPHPADLRETGHPQPRSHPWTLRRLVNARATLNTGEG